MPKVAMQPIRRQQLIDATLAAVNELGVAEVCNSRKQGSFMACFYF